MSFHFPFLRLFLAALLIGFQPSAFAVTDAQTLALQKWGSRHAELGGLQNPPVGRVQPEVRELEKLVREIVKNLKPEIFNNYQLTFGVYGSHEPNAFMEKVDLKSKENRLVIRKFYQLDPTQPVYHLGVSQGLFRTLSTVDQVAAVIAHELIHLLEGHLDSPDIEHERAKRWFSTQRLEAVTDHMALDLLVGKYDIDALRDSLWTLAEIETRADPSKKREELGKLIQAMHAGASSHHDRGVRIGMVQAKAEHLKSTHPKALEPVVKALPERLRRLEGTGNAGVFLGRSLDPKTRDRIAAIHLELTKRSLKRPTLIVTLGASLASADNADLATKENFEALAEFSPDRETMLDLLNRAFRSIEKIPRYSPEKRAAAIWNAAHFYKGTDATFDSLQGGEFDFLVAREMMPWLKHPKFDVTKFLTTVFSSPRIIFQNPFLQHLAHLENVQKMWAIGIQNFLYPTYARSEENHWSNKRETESFRLGQFTTFLINEPFARQEKLDSMSEKQRNKQEANLHLKRSRAILVKLLDEHTKSLDDPKFVDTAIVSRPDEYFGLLSSTRKDEFEDVVRRSTFLKKIQELEADVTKKTRRDIKKTLQAIAGSKTELNEDHITEVNRVLYLTNNYLARTQEEQELLRRIYFRALERALNSLQPTVYSDVSGLFHSFLETGSVPLGTVEQDMRTLIYLVAEGGSSDESTQAKGRELFQKLLNRLGAKAVRQLLVGPIDDKIEKRFQQELKSQRYKENLREYRELQKKKNQLEKLHVNWSQTNLELVDATIQLSEKGGYFRRHAGMSQNEQARELGALSLLAEPLLREEMSKLFSLQDLEQITRKFYTLRSRAERREREFDLTGVKNPLKLRGWNPLDFPKHVSFLLKVFANHQNSIKDFGDWMKLYRSLLTISLRALDYVPELRSVFEKRYLELSNGGKDPRAYLFIRRAGTTEGLTENALISTYFEEFVRRLGARKDPESLKRVFEEINQDSEIKTKLPDIYLRLQEKIAEDLRLQPQTISFVFPETNSKINTENTAGLDGEVRGISLVANLLRSRTTQEQLNMIEYVMGRSPEVPNFALEWEKKTSLPISNIIYQMRTRLSHESELVRAFTLNMLLTGPDGLAQGPEANQVIIDRYFKNSDNRKIAEEITQALTDSLGRDRSFIFAYVLAQKSKTDTQLSEGEILKGVLEVAFGVPGRKLAQYLGFTSELKSLQEALASSQDSAAPLSYLEILRLLNTQMGLEFGEKWEVVRALGSGSVNIAIEILRKANADVRVISVLRESIEVAAQKDFLRLANVANELARRNFDHYGFLPGLLEVIENSVKLEFNKRNSHDRQAEAALIYSRQVEGWTFNVPKVESVTQFGLIMEKASGKTARKIREQNFELYKETMEIVLESEWKHLLNSNFLRNRTSAFANPDLHDGQVIIDKEKKTITLLDFGQAIPISLAERDLGVQTIRLLAQTENRRDFDVQVQRLKQLTGGQVDLERAQLERIYAKKEMMDRFIYLLGASKLAGWKIPLSTVHFVLGMNRILKLGDVIGYDLRAPLKRVLFVRDITRSTELGYFVDKLTVDLGRAAKDVVRQCRALLGGS
ncbi:MAG: AarF/UbiB family protein [Bdellovibrionales bacterium]